MRRPEAAVAPPPTRHGASTSLQPWLQILGRFVPAWRKPRLARRAEVRVPLGISEHGAAPKDLSPTRKQSLSSFPIWSKSGRFWAAQFRLSSKYAINEHHRRGGPTYQKSKVYAFS